MKSGLIISVFWISICTGVLGDNVMDIEDEIPHHNDMVYKKEHVTPWTNLVDDSRPKPEHDVEYGFKHGHGHENLRGDMEVNDVDCVTDCTLDFKPVCGSDGVTYDNKCRLETASCNSGKYIYVAYQGKC